MKKKATLIIALAAAFSCTAAFAGPADSSRWTIDGDYAIRWDIGNDIPHYDHIEMSGEQVSVVYRYGVNEDGAFSMDRSVVWPMLRTVPNDTHASLTVHFDTDFMSGVTVDGKALEGEKVRSITLDGIMSVLSTYGNAPVEVTECYFPSPTRAAVCERYTITNTGENEISVFVPAVRNVTETDPEAGTEGSYTLIASTGSGIDRSYRIAPGKSISFGATIRGLKQPQMEIPIDVDREKAEREDFVKTICGELVLESPDPVLNTMFGFSKIRGAESIFATRGGLMQCPGGEAYYAAIWCNDQAEYINPFFPFLGYDKGNESAVNSFLHFAAYMNPDFNFIPWSVIAEGYESHGPFDRGDAAMLAYGASRYALAMGDLQIAETLMPLIDWSLEYCSRKINSEGVVASDADELELRFPAGEANLCTSSLYYDALRSTAWLIETMADEYAADGESAESSAAADEAASRAAELRERAATLKGNIEKYFGADMDGFHTYRYFKGNDVLRSWICIPLVMDIFDRKEGTVQALLSPIRERSIYGSRDGRVLGQGHPVCTARHLCCRISGKGYRASGRILTAPPARRACPVPCRSMAGRRPEASFHGKCPLLQDIHRRNPRVPPYRIQDLQPASAASRKLGLFQHQQHTRMFLPPLRHTRQAFGQETVRNRPAGRKDPGVIQYP